VKYRDDGRELVTWLEYLTIHTTFPFLNAWASYYLTYTISVLMITMCPYSRPDLKDKIWCNGDYSLPEKQYEFSIFTWTAYFAYALLTCENMIYLAYYKDVAFSFAVVGEFCGMFYFAKQTEQSDVQFTFTVVGVLAWMISINVVCGVATLGIHWDSAFYTKQRQFRK